MNKKLKEFSKIYLIGFILGILSVGVVNVIAATYFPSGDVMYDNGTSGLSSTNVQGAIDEMYKTCRGIISVGGKDVETVTSGDGLYEDEYEDRYFYKGANPNNYVTFNNEKAGWRIISIESDGTIKIIRNDSIGEMEWDTSGSNNWNRPATLNTYLNGTYYNSLSSTTQGQIATHFWSIGATSIRGEELDIQVHHENANQWQGKIALPTLSEYFRTNSNTSCNNYEAIDDNIVTCRNSTWMYNSSINWWTLTPNGSSFVFRVSSSGTYSAYSWANGSNEIRPTVYLSSEVQITGGNGTQSDPYTLS